MSASDIYYFPSHYLSSREHFAKSLKPYSEFITEAWKIPSKTESDLYVDVAYAPTLKSEDFLLVVTSGIHGSETYAGSAIQQMFINEIYPRLDRSKQGFSSFIR